MQYKNKYKICLTLGVILTVLILFLSLFIGSDGLNFNTNKTILSYRLIRIILSLIAGSSLAISGASLQGIFKNYLADPHLLGISGGAALGACISIAFFSEEFFLLPSIGALIGGFIAFIIIFSFLTKNNNVITNTLLVGILINSLAASLISMLKIILPAQKSQNLLFWLVGQINIVEPEYFILIILIWITGSYILIKFRGELEILSFGKDEATLLGINSSLVIKIVILANCLLIANVVAFCGMIGFVGLVIPHFIRLFKCYDLRLLLPLAFVFGGLCLLIFDSLSRLSFYFFSTEIPVGALCSLFLSPLFFWLLLRLSNETKSYN